MATRKPKKDSDPGEVVDAARALALAAKIAELAGRSGPWPEVATIATAVARAVQRNDGAALGKLASEAREALQRELRSPEDAARPRRDREGKVWFDGRVGGPFVKSAAVKRAIVALVRQNLDAGTSDRTLALLAERAIGHAKLAPSPGPDWLSRALLALERVDRGQPSAELDVLRAVLAGMGLSAADRKRWLEPVVKRRHRSQARRNRTDKK